MIKIENTVFLSAEQWRAIVMGCRNPLNSWAKSDSYRYSGKGPSLKEDGLIDPLTGCHIGFEVGPNDLALMKKLANAGTDHRKFMRMITVYLDITAPLYWWKEFDTYKVGTVANSCSTMHKIADKEFTESDFSCEHLGDAAMFYLRGTINYLNDARSCYLSTKEKEWWWQLIQLLPSSYNQRRTVMLNYEVLANIYKSRRNHKLDEWHTFCDWIETLPYSELITGEKEEK